MVFFVSALVLWLASVLQAASSNSSTEALEAAPRSSFQCLATGFVRRCAARVRRIKLLLLLRVLLRKVSVHLHDLEALQDLRLDVDYLRARRNLSEIHRGSVSRRT